MSEYVWEKSFTITAPKITCEITITGTPEVGYEQTINVAINNARTEDSSGSVTVEILKDTTVVETLESTLSITVPAGSSWPKTYTWTPTEEGNYKVKVTYTET